MYVETSGSGSNGKVILTLISRCVDLSAYTDPALVFAYQYVWCNNGYFKCRYISNDTGSDMDITYGHYQWRSRAINGQETVVSLQNSYSGSVYVQVRMNYSIRNFLYF